MIGVLRVGIGTCIKQHLGDGLVGSGNTQAESSDPLPVLGVYHGIVVHKNVQKFDISIPGGVVEGGPPLRVPGVDLSCCLIPIDTSILGCPTS